MDCLNHGPLDLAWAPGPWTPDLTPQTMDRLIPLDHGQLDHAPNRMTDRYLWRQNFPLYYARGWYWWNVVTFGFWGYCTYLFNQYPSTVIFRIEKNGTEFRDSVSKMSSILIWWRLFPSFFCKTEPYFEVTKVIPKLWNFFLAWRIFSPYFLCVRQRLFSLSISKR